MDRKHQFKRKSEAAGAMRDKRRRERHGIYKLQVDYCSSLDWKVVGGAFDIVY